MALISFHSVVPATNRETRLAATEGYFSGAACPVMPPPCFGVHAQESDACTLAVKDTRDHHGPRAKAMDDPTRSAGPRAPWIEGKELTRKAGIVAPGSKEALLTRGTSPRATEKD